MIGITNTYKKKHFNNLQLFLLFGIGLILFPSPIFAHHRFIIFALIPFLSLSYLFFFKKKVSLKLNFLDIGYIIFIGLGFLSYFWAINKSLIWYFAFGYLGFGLWLFLLRNLLFLNQKKAFLSLLSILFFCFVQFYVVCAFVLGGINKSLVEWNFFFSYNSNYISTLFVSLLPFLLFYKSYSFFIKFLKFVSIIFTGYIIFIARAKGAFLSFIIVGCYYLWTKLSRKYFNLLILTLIVVICICSIVVDDYSSLPILNEIGSDGDSVRLFMIKSSFDILKEKPFWGIGLGNWFMEAYNRDLTEIIGLNVYSFVRLGNHNLYSQHLAEMGLLGFVGYYFSFVIVLYNGFRKQLKKANLELAALGLILVYLITSIAYRDVNIYEKHFSGIQFLAFCSLGLLTKERVFFIQLSKKGLSVIWWLSLLTFLWFVYYHQTSRIYAKAQIVEEINSDESLLLLESIYHPVFKTTHHFYQHSTGSNRSLALKIAQLYQEKNNYEKAEKYYQKALVDTPNDEYVLLNYSKFLLRIRNDYNNARKKLLLINNKQNNHLEVNLLLAEIAINDKEYSKAREYLNTRYLQRKEEVNFLEQQIYYSEYLNDLVKLDRNQKSKIKESATEYKIKSSKFSTFLSGMTLTEKELVYLRENIYEETSKQDELLFSCLNNEQFSTYLLDRYKNFYARQLWVLSHLISLTKSQLTKIEELLLEVSVEKKKSVLEIESISNLNNKEKKFEIKQIIDSIGIKIDLGLTEILLASQYKRYKEYQDKNHLFYKRN